MEQLLLVTSCDSPAGIGASLRTDKRMDRQTWRWLQYIRDLVRAGATGASAPAEICQRVRRTRPEESGLVSRTALRAKNPNFNTICPLRTHQIHVITIMCLLI